ncbi:MAG: hypothetical protein KC561_00920 [Myxococcales bacterium]|nr:hypothetical protein [Myxococcales bacterium]
MGARIVSLIMLSSVGVWVFSAAGQNSSSTASTESPSSLADAQLLDCVPHAAEAVVWLDDVEGSLFDWMPGLTSRGAEQAERAAVVWASGDSYAACVITPSLRGSERSAGDLRVVVHELPEGGGYLVLAGTPSGVDASLRAIESRRTNFPASAPSPGRWSRGAPAGRAHAGLVVGEPNMSQSAANVDPLPARVEEVHTAVPTSRFPMKPQADESKRTAR